MWMTYPHLLELSDQVLRVLMIDLWRNNLIESDLLNFIYIRGTLCLLIKTISCHTYSCLSYIMHFWSIILRNLAREVLMRDHHSWRLCRRINNLRRLCRLPLTMMLLMPINHGGHLINRILSITRGSAWVINLRLILRLLRLHYSCLRCWNITLLTRNHWLLLLCLLYAMTSSRDSLWKSDLLSFYFNLFGIPLIVIILRLNYLALRIQKFLFCLGLNLCTPYWSLDWQWLVSLSWRLGMILLTLMYRLK